MKALMRLCLLLAGLLPLVPALAQLTGDEELLDPDKAFQFSAEVVGPDRVRATWTAAEGYYLYRSKLRLSTESTGVTLGDPALPAGKKKEDPAFGQVEIYHGTVTAELPVNLASDASRTFTLTAAYQGCAEVGVCYPPQRKEVTLTLPPGAAPAPAPVAEAPASSPATTAGGGLLNGLDFNTGEPEVLDPEVAFVPTVRMADADTIQVSMDIVPGHYLYRERFKFALIDPPAGVTLGEAQVPAGEEKDDEFFGRIQVHHHPLEIRIPVQHATASGPITLELGYQGCSEVGVCYPPQKKRFELVLAGGTTEAGVTPAPTATTTSSAAPSTSAASRSEPLSQQDELAAQLQSGNTMAVLLSFFGLGLLLAFTPCVFPMIPILSSIIVGQGSSLTTQRAFTLSVVYVLAMALTYTAAGVVAGLFGSNIQAMFQNPWVLGSFSAVFVALSLSMFGFYELQLPSALQTRLTEVSNRQQGGTLAGVAIMGLLSALIVGPCVAPPLMGALIYIGQTGDPWLGGSALFALSLGMGAPLVVVGTSAGKLLPRAGGWMDAVKAVFGVLLLAVAIWMLERVIPAWVNLLLWALLALTSAVYMGALDAANSGWQRLWKGLGVALLVWGALLLVGLASGGRDPMAPLAHLKVMGGVGGAAMAPAHLEFRRVKSEADLERELAAAAAASRPVMLDFYADWCVSCKEFEKYTFADPSVVAALEGILTLQADVTANDDEDQALLKRFQLIGPPAILFYGADGQERRGYRLVGFEEAEKFKARVEQATR